ncbi:TRAP transporter small permease [Halomonas sp. HL-93]|uniref:TRAP transporter small permease n=1 Tax=Halomonas sp. HL-93 TaxID=1666906 RepID=UPI0006DAC24D|nr:TRAP transporter small permease [Halomonas sp. HL-93]KPQ31042.1 MAG: TRAP-type C4-dicarboxylate transport system, small permease component [Halomonas sp. HL-93]SBR46002.1 TRAP-type C4-dicarboxylate transport system, small permease component [Halomonas sp. HL-93]
MNDTRDDSPPIGDPMIDFEAGFDDTPFRLSDYRLEDLVTLILFWALILVVFAQFFSRYILGDSIGWTEEIARYLLIGVGFLGSVMAARNGSHIMVEFFYHYMPGWQARLMEGLVNIVSLIFYIAMAWVTFQLASRTNSLMVSIDLPKSIIYFTVCAAFVLMAMRTVQRLYLKYRTRPHDV